MARVEITAVDVDRTTSDQPVQVSSDASDDMVVLGGADGLTIIEVENTDSVDRTITVLANPALDAPDDLSFGAGLDIVVPDGETVVRGVFRTSSYRQNTDNDLYIDVTHDTVLKFRAYRVELPT